MLSGVFFQLWEWLALPVYILIIFILSYLYQKRKIKENPLYRFYTWGLFARIFGALFFGLIYEYYYLAGDTFGYYLGAVNMDNLFIQSPIHWFKVEFEAASDLNYSYFNEDTGYPLLYLYHDPRTFMVVRFINLVMLPAFNSYLLATVIIAWFCYVGIWKMFLVFARYYPHLEKQLAIALLFFPSVLFWASGILKDTITLSCTGWVVFCIYQAFVLKRQRILYLLLLVFNIYIILSIKPYILFALLPGSLMWIFSDRIYKIKNAAARALVLPLIVIICVGGGYYIMSNLSSYMGKFSIDNVAKTALVTQNDMKQAYYQGHSFDIGLDDQSYSGFVKKSPQAFVAGVYRPFLWESGNIVMLLSGVENTFILVLTVLMLLRTNVLTIISRLFSEPLLFFALTFSIFFAIAVGMTTSNFGAMARFKTAYLPFFMVSLFILYKRRKDTESIEA